jgi:hypothetical protein
MDTRGGDNNTHNYHSKLTKELAKIEADKKIIHRMQKSALLDACHIMREFLDNAIHKNITYLLSWICPDNKVNRRKQFYDITTTTTTTTTTTIIIIIIIIIQYNLI